MATAQPIVRTLFDSSISNSLWIIEEGWTIFTERMAIMNTANENLIPPDRGDFDLRVILINELSDLGF